MILALLVLLAPRPADRFHLRFIARDAGLPPLVVEAIAEQETAGNLDPAIRGHACRGRQDCDVGRFQIKPSTAAARCPGVDVRTYRGNTECFLAMFGQDARAHGVRYAIRHHNGNGPSSVAYARQVLERVGRLYVEDAK